MKILYAIALLALISCTDDDRKNGLQTCNFDSIESHPWLIELKNSMTNCSCELSIIQGTYRNQTVFFGALTDPLCNGLNTPILFNCEGRPIKSFSDSAADQKELTDNVTRDKVLYRCND
jgi:hypothetical protein